MTRGISKWLTWGMNDAGKYETELVTTLNDLLGSFAFRLNHLEAYTWTDLDIEVKDFNRLIIPLHEKLSTMKTDLWCIALPPETGRSDKFSTNIEDTNVIGQACQHSPDFRSVVFEGKVYCFTATQAKIIEVLWEAWENGTPSIGAAYLLEAAEAKSSRLVDIFRGSPAWGTLVVDGESKGTKRLNLTKKTEIHI
jgi:hypothetical protein